MCGIFGFVSASSRRLSTDAVENLMARLFRLSESRGREASGLAVLAANEINLCKGSIPGSRLIRLPEYRQLLRKASDNGGSLPNRDSPFAAIGHSRLVTSGGQKMDVNNQPLENDGIALVHNGIIVNVDALWENNPKLKRRGEVDTEIILTLLAEHMKAGLSAKDSLCATFADIEGEASVAILLAEANKLMLATNTGSIFTRMDADRRSMSFASESFILNRLYAGKAGNGAVTEQVKAGTGIVIDLSRLDREPVVLPANDHAMGRTRRQRPDRRVAAGVSGSGVMASLEASAEQDRQQRVLMRRCMKCILPETVPFIVFDQEGICNYCRHYRKSEPGNRGSLESQLARYRDKSREADCVVAFSGGRDSSYCLHLLKMEFGMTPIAYTYDWGMVTDLARRNQSRLCGQLGIQHIWVSADIGAKRRNIRRNVTAWLKRPHLGMIPLFMAGDKQFFWFANKVMAQTGIELLALCENQLEKTDFKSGFCGIRPKFGERRPNVLSGMQKLQLAMFFGGQYLLNPKYLNQSLPDTLSAFASYYLIRHDYVHLFDYIRWDENEIVDTLQREYDWETADDTSTTWRIGDGTAPFYNFLYLTLAGFTEHDTFRSNQIREGDITRHRALELIEVENRPRWESIRDYLRLIDLDFTDVLSAVNRMPRLYGESAESLR